MSKQVNTGEDSALAYESPILSLVLNKTTFLWALCLASVIPLFIGGLVSLNIIGISTTISIIIFLGLIHVPITLYLFTDDAIRGQAVARPAVLILAPFLLIALSIYVYLTYSTNMGTDSPQYLFYFMFAAVSWQHWHFGKQNVGVFAFSSLATKSGPMPKVARLMIVAGAVCGVLAAYSLTGEGFKKQYSPDVDLSTFDSIMTFLTMVGRFSQYCLTAASLIYVFINRHAFTLPTAVLFLIGVNFFLPQYFSIDFPDAAFVFTHWLMAHGLQYHVFLFYHSFGMARIEAQKPTLTEAQAVGRLKRFVRICAGPAAFAISLVIVSDFYGWGIFMSFNRIIEGVLNWTMGLGLSNSVIINIGGGLVVGILLTHFWLDTFLWRLKDKTPREWARSRYNFLF